jgi:sugar/nucleoside kinase (ribokinase family)
MQFDYICIGHVSVDLLEDGQRRPGGTALYAGLQAARLGLRTLILTRGVPAEVEAMLAPWAAELELRVQPSAETTTLATAGRGAERSQRLLAWAGPIETEERLECAILHLAPVARELPERWPAGGTLRGLTPQGLARSLPAAGGPIRCSPPTAGAVSQAGTIDALVISEQERASCAPLLERALAGGALLAVTAGEQPTSILRPGAAEALELPVSEVAEPVDDIGAGDVFAAALFVGLAEGRSATQAAALGGAAAAIRLRAEGPQAIGHRARVEAALAEAPPGRP